MVTSLSTSFLCNFKFLSIDTAYKVQAPSALVSTKNDEIIYFIDGNNIGALVYNNSKYRSILVAGGEFL